MLGVDSRVRRRLPDPFKKLPLLRDLGGLVFDEDDLKSDELTQVRCP